MPTSNAYNSVLLSWWFLKLSVIWMDNVWIFLNYSRIVFYGFFVGGLCFYKTRRKRHFTHRYSLYFFSLSCTSQNAWRCMLFHKIYANLINECYLVCINCYSELHPMHLTKRPHINLKFPHFHYFVHRCLTQSLLPTTLNKCILYFILLLC